MRLLLISLALSSLVACARDAAPPEPEAATEEAAAVEPDAKPPAEEVVALDLRTSVPPPSLLDPPEEVVSDSGLKSVVYARGNGQPADAGDLVAVHYSGFLADDSAPEGRGNKFDSSVDRGEPITFQLGTGRVIPGWDEGIAQMSEGGKRTLIIPPDLAYGSRGGGGGLIPPDSTLIFDVELVSVTKP